MITLLNVCAIGDPILLTTASTNQITSSRVTATPFGHHIRCTVYSFDDWFDQWFGDTSDGLRVHLIGQSSAIGSKAICIAAQLVSSVNKAIETFLSVNQTANNSSDFFSNFFYLNIPFWFKINLTSINLLTNCAEVAFP